MNKTVYILGAGFSIEAGAPAQNQIIKNIFDHKNLFSADIFNKFTDFLKNTLCINEDNFTNIRLEDIFSPLDKCIIENNDFRNLSLEQAKKIRDIIIYLIGKTFNEILKEVNVQYINTFAKHITDLASIRIDNYKNNDPVSVLSLNWDIILDNAINKYIKQYYNINPNNNYDECKAVIDYCCYVSSHVFGDFSIMPGLEMLGKGGFNVKLLKLHGSYNWLQCPNCQRIFIEFGEKIGVTQYNHQTPCRHCNSNYLGNHILQSNLIMPTFLKNLSNPQYRIIWQNAGIEISEASKIIFIGYSLPYADFEIRNLLSRMVRKNAKIEVVTKGHKNSHAFKELKTNYSSFFGDREIMFHNKGAKDYIMKKCNRRCQIPSTI